MKEAAEAAEALDKCGAKAAGKMATNATELLKKSVASFLPVK